MTVESRKGAVPESYCMPTRFPSPLIKPDVPVSSIRLSDRLHQLAHGSGPKCTSRSRSTPNFPNTIAFEKLMAPRMIPCGGAVGSDARARGRNDRPLGSWTSFAACSRGGRNCRSRCGRPLRPNRLTLLGLVVSGNVDKGTDDPQVQPVVSSGRVVAEIHLKANPVIVLRTTEENAGSWRFRKAFTRL